MRSRARSTTCFGEALRETELDALAESVMGIVDASWRPLLRVRDEALDEVDARIDTLIVKLEARDPLTSEHSRAVSAWCSRLGRRLGLDSAEVTFAARCGLLHDVGKVATPLEVLNAPRALDDREWRLIRAHAAAGEAIVRAVPELRPFAPAVRSHHERLDGTRLPRPAAGVRDPADGPHRRGRGLVQRHDRPPALPAADAADPRARRARAWSRDPVRSRGR